MIWAPGSVMDVSRAVSIIRIFLEHNVLEAYLFFIYYILAKMILAARSQEYGPMKK
jgi:hypothetical protein